MKRSGLKQSSASTHLSGAKPGSIFSKKLAFLIPFTWTKAFFFSFFCFEIILCVTPPSHDRIATEKRKEKRNFKSIVMPNFIIKTHQKDTVYKGNQIFILNKGMNSGQMERSGIHQYQKNNIKALINPKKNLLPTALLSYVQTKRMPKQCIGLLTVFGNPTSGTRF